MALVDDLLKGVALEEVLAGGNLPGVAAGIGALLLAPVVIPVVAGIGKPAAKAMIKEGLRLYEKSKESFAEMGEMLEDLVAEAKSELATEEQTQTNRSEVQPQTIVVSD